MIIFCSSCMPSTAASAFSFARFSSLDSRPLRTCKHGAQPHLSRIHPVTATLLAIVNGFEKIILLFGTKRADATTDTALESLIHCYITRWSEVCGNYHGPCCHHHTARILAVGVKTSSRQLPRTLLLSHYKECNSAQRLALFQSSIMLLEIPFKC